MIWLQPLSTERIKNSWSKSDSKFKETKLYTLFFLDDESQRTFSNTFPLKDLDLQVCVIVSQIKIHYKQLLFQLGKIQLENLLSIYPLPLVKAY